MKNLSTVLTLSLVSTSIMFATAATALAEGDVSARSMAPASNTLEIAVNGTYSQGTGDVGGGMPSVQDIAGAGGGLELAVGWRATPNLLIGGYANLSGYQDENDSDKGVATAAAGIKADWHFLPAASIDPWVSVGTGVKFMGIEAGTNDRALTGLELAKFQVGTDFRISPSFAIGPVIGASATLYTHQYDDVMSDDAVELDDKKVNWTFSAGLLGRFDAFSAR